MTPLIMPQVGQDIPSASIVEWVKQEGDAVTKGEVVLVVESEKAAFEVEAEEDGVLLKILHQDGDEVEILQPVGYVGQPGESVEDVPAEGAPATTEPAAEEAEVPKPSPERRAPSDRVVASPSAKRLAHEHGVDLAQVTGTGPGGRIVNKDVLAAAERSAGAPEGQDQVIPYGRLRKRMAQRLTQSKQTIPDFHLFIDVDMTDAMEWRRAVNEEHGTRITVTDLVVKATANALTKHPRLNAHADDTRLTLKGDINLGVAVSVEDGLLVPTIANADRKSLAEVAAASRANAEAARRGVLSSSAEGTFTITSLGMLGIKQFLPVINPPQVAILAVGCVEPRVVPVPDGIGVRQMMTLTLACDHRAIDGADGAALLNEIKDSLENITILAARPRRHSL